MGANFNIPCTSDYWHLFATQSAQSGTREFTSEGIRVVSPSSGAFVFSYAETLQKYDLTNISTITARVYSPTSNASDYERLSVYTESLESDPTNFRSSASVVIGRSGDVRTVTLDVSELSGEYYINFLIDFGSALEIYEVVIENYDFKWYIIDGQLTNINAPSLPVASMVKPYPKKLWRIDPNVNDGFPYNELQPNVPETAMTGAFMNARNLEHVYIPRSCKTIGEWAFTNTALKKVRLPSDCTYFSTSFPLNCEIEFYGGGGEYGQLYDGNGCAVVDGSGARIYVKE